MGKKCSFNGCKTSCTFGIEKMKPIHCSKHRQENEKDVVNKMCEKCNLKQCTYGLVKKQPQWCFKCKPDNTFDVKHTFCESCNIRPTFGTTKSIRCAAHKKENDIPKIYNKFNIF